MNREIFYTLADRFFFIFHISLIIFNLAGWAWRKTRVLNLITLSLTFLSWFVLGIFYGWGYCFLTDWHWQVREELGLTFESDSYIHFLITQLFAINIKEHLVDIFTIVFFFAALITSVALNIRDLKRTVR